jgi:hypothetical protein
MVRERRGVFMMKLRSLICPFLAAGAGILSLGIAIMACPLKTPAWISAAPVALGAIVVIFALGRANAMAERCRAKQLQAQQED